MTNPTPHGQVPEALIDLIDAYAETRHRCGGIYNAKTEAARKALIEALSGVQALSAAPEAFLKGVIALCSHRGYSPTNIEAWDKDDKWIADLWRQAEAMLAASPTPPAEQQAAPKAAPGVGNSGFDHQTAADLLSSKTVNDEAVRKFVQASRWAHDEKAALSAMLLSVRGVLASREAEIALLKKALMEAEAAPQQEAQEPVAISEAIERMAADRYKVVPSHESMFHRWAVVAGTGTQQLYLGREVECQNMARKFAGAFLDGAFVAMQQAAPQQAAQEPVAWMWQHEETGRTGFVDCWQIENGFQENNPQLRLVAKLYAAPQPAPAPLIARSLAEWHEDDGCVAWWAWNGREWAGEPAWIGNPNCEDWPGYHTHWTPHPDQPVFSALAAQGGQR